MIQSHGQTSSSDTSANIEQIEQKVRAQMVLKGGAGWFLYVTAISLINTILSLRRSSRLFPPFMGRFRGN